MSSARAANWHGGGCNGELGILPTFPGPGRGAAVRQERRPEVTTMKLKIEDNSVVSPVPLWHALPGRKVGPALEGRAGFGIPDHGSGKEIANGQDSQTTGEA